jgi:hypothetical protein
VDTRSVRINEAITASTNDSRSGPSRARTVLLSVCTRRGLAALRFSRSSLAILTRLFKTFGALVVDAATYYGETRRTQCPQLSHSKCFKPASSAFHVNRSSRPLADIGCAANRTIWAPPIAAMHGSTAANSRHHRQRQENLSLAPLAKRNDDAPCYAIIGDPAVRLRLTTLPGQNEPS